jgi:hypothetical protein
MRALVFGLAAAVFLALFAAVPPASAQVPGPYGFGPTTSFYAPQAAIDPFGQPYPLQGEGAYGPPVWTMAGSPAPGAWGGPMAPAAYVDPVAIAGYVNLTNAVGYQNAVNAVTYQNLANAATYRNMVRVATYQAALSWR